MRGVQRVRTKTRAHENSLKQPRISNVWFMLPVKIEPSLNIYLIDNHVVLKTIVHILGKCFLILCKLRTYHGYGEQTTKKLTVWGEHGFYDLTHILLIDFPKVIVAYTTLMDTRF